MEQTFALIKPDVVGKSLFKEEVEKDDEGEVTETRQITVCFFEYTRTNVHHSFKSLSSSSVITLPVPSLCFGPSSHIRMGGEGCG